MESEHSVNYFLDTNIIISHPDCIVDGTFLGGNIAIPAVVITELEKFKGELSSRGVAARKFGRSLRELLKNNSHTNRSFLLENTFGQKIEILSMIDDKEYLFDGVNYSDPDHMILKTASQFKNAHSDQKIILVTNDVYLAIKADKCGLETRDFFQLETNPISGGQRTVYTDEQTINFLIEKKSD